MFRTRMVAAKSQHESHRNRNILYSSFSAIPNSQLSSTASSPQQSDSLNSQLSKRSTKMGTPPIFAHNVFILPPAPTSTRKNFVAASDERCRALTKLPGARQHTGPQCSRRKVPNTALALAQKTERDLVADELCSQHTSMVERFEASQVELVSVGCQAQPTLQVMIIKQLREEGKFPSGSAGGPPVVAVSSGSASSNSGPRGDGTIGGTGFGSNMISSTGLTSSDDRVFSNGPSSSNDRFRNTDRASSEHLMPSNSGVFSNGLASNIGIRPNSSRDPRSNIDVGQSSGSTFPSTTSHSRGPPPHSESIYGTAAFDFGVTSSGAILDEEPGRRISYSNNTGTAQNVQPSKSGPLDNTASKDSGEPSSGTVLDEGPDYRTSYSNKTSIVNVQPSKSGLLDSGIRKDAGETSSDIIHDEEPGCVQPSKSGPLDDNASKDSGEPSSGTVLDEGPSCRTSYSDKTSIVNVQPSKSGLLDSGIRKDSGETSSNTIYDAEPGHRTSHNNKTSVVDDFQPSKSSLLDNNTSKDSSDLINRTAGSGVPSVPANRPTHPETIRNPRTSAPPSKTFNPVNSPFSPTNAKPSAVTPKDRNFHTGTAPISSPHSRNTAFQIYTVSDITFHRIPDPLIDITAKHYIKANSRAVHKVPSGVITHFDTYTGGISPEIASNSKGLRNPSSLVKLYINIVQGHRHSQNPVVSKAFEVDRQRALKV